ncbi:hypothetical protein MYA_2369 [Burkholderia sp. KJ006]|nr:hypothetical protein MYA_2369 [Burkholderia sp. KJ006]
MAFSFCAAARRGDVARKPAIARIAAAVACMHSWVPKAERHGKPWRSALPAGAGQ